MDSGGFFFLIAVLVTGLLILLIIADYHWNFLPQSHAVTNLEMRRIQQSQVSTGLAIEMATFGGAHNTDRPQTGDSNAAMGGAGGLGIRYPQGRV